MALTRLEIYFQRPERLNSWTMRNDTLMTPGPVPIPPEVLNVLAQPMEHHRTPEFIALFRRVLGSLKDVFLTNQPVFIQTSTGSGAMEAALVNCLSPGDQVLAVVSGKFGERWADMAETYGARVMRLEVPWGQSVRSPDVARVLEENPGIVAVLCQACETSTGALHPIQELARLTSGHQAILMVDAITALGALPIPMDEWGVDVLLGGSQKAFMLPTGLAFLSFSKKAWRKVETARCPRFYFDVRKEKTANEHGESAFSSAVTHIRALDLVLKIFLERGLEHVHGRIQALSRATLAAIDIMGLKCFPEHPSPSLTAVRMPGKIDGQKVRSAMETSHRVVVMGGQDQLKGQIIRIGHMGAIRDQDLLQTLNALALCLNDAQPGLVADDKIQKALAVAQTILDAHPAIGGSDSSR